MTESRELQRGPACLIENRKVIQITAFANSNWSRFWSSKAAAQAWDSFMATAKHMNLGGWYDSGK